MRVHCIAVCLLLKHLSKVMTPLDTYTRDIKQHGFQQDDAQLKAVQSLDKLYHDFIEYVSNPVVKKTGWKRWFSKTQAQPVAPKGLYFWGGVGRGKTYLMDTFFEALPCEKRCVYISIALCTAFMMS